MLIHSWLQILDIAYSHKLWKINYLFISAMNSEVLSDEENDMEMCCLPAFKGLVSI